MNKTIFSNMLLNNLKAVAIHVGVCFVMFLPLFIIMGPGDLWTESMLERGTLITQGLAIGIYTINVLVLFFVSGRFLLTKTHNVLANIFSVAILPGIIILSDFLAFSRNGTSSLDILAIPILPISETISFFLPIKRVYVYLAMSLLLLFTMWLGMVTKSKNSKLIDFDQPF